MQKIVEYLLTQEAVLLYNSMLLPVVNQLINDVNGNHVIQKYIISINFPFNQELFKMLIQNSFEYSTQKHGCCVIQKCIDYGTQAQQVFDSLRKLC